MSRSGDQSEADVVGAGRSVSEDAWHLNRLLTSEQGRVSYKHFKARKAACANVMKEQGG